MNDLSPEMLILASSLLLAIATALFLIWIIPFWDALTAWMLDDLTPRMRDLNLDTKRLAPLMRLWAGLVIGSAVLIGLVLGMPALAIPVVFLILRAPRAMVQGMIARQKTILRDQLVSGCVALANATRAGLALPQGMEAVIPETPDPLAAEFRRMHTEFQHGRPFPDCIREAKQRLAIDSFTLFASALLVCLDRGGKVTEALERISKSLLENQRLERKLEADTASGRLVVRILSLCPLFFLGLFGMLDPPGTMLLFTTALGQVILLVAAALVYIAVRWARFLLKIEGGL